MIKRNKCDIDQQLEEEFLRRGYYVDPTIRRTALILGAFFLVHLALLITSIFLDWDIFVFTWIFRIGMVGSIMFGLFSGACLYVAFIAPRHQKHNMNTAEYRAHIKKSSNYLGNSARR